MPRNATGYSTPPPPGGGRENRVYLLTGGDLKNLMAMIARLQADNKLLQLKLAQLERRLERLESVRA